MSTGDSCAIGVYSIQPWAVIGAFLYISIHMNDATMQSAHVLRKRWRQSSLRRFV